MIEIYDTTEFQQAEPSVVTLGKFDGLHRGHQKLIREVLRLQDLGYYGIAFTIAPEESPALLTAKEKRDLFEASGVDCMIRCPYVPDILGMEPETFVSDVLVRQMKARYIVVGTDFRFGYKRRGDVTLLRALQGKYGFRLLVLEKERHEGREISSTYIKEALADADMELVNHLLGYTYPVTGTVEHGKHLGRCIGMPTINLVPDKWKLLPPKGVYFSEVHSSRFDCHGVTNVGCKPTVGGASVGVETYLYGIHEDLYGESVKVMLKHFRRPERKFDSIEELKTQMQQDTQAGEKYFQTSFFG